jgi:hypothetical protein
VRCLENVSFGTAKNIEYGSGKGQLTEFDVPNHAQVPIWCQNSVDFLECLVGRKPGSMLDHIERECLETTNQWNACAATTASATPSSSGILAAFPSTIFTLLKPFPTSPSRILACGSTATISKLSSLFANGTVNLSC